MGSENTDNYTDQELKAASMAEWMGREEWRRSFNQGEHPQRNRSSGGCGLPGLLVVILLIVPLFIAGSIAAVWIAKTSNESSGLQGTWNGTLTCGADSLEVEAQIEVTTIANGPDRVRAAIRYIQVQPEGPIPLGQASLVGTTDDGMLGLIAVPSADPELSGYKIRSLSTPYKSGQKTITTTVDSEMCSRLDLRRR